MVQLISMSLTALTDFVYLSLDPSYAHIFFYLHWDARTLGRRPPKFWTRKILTLDSERFQYPLSNKTLISCTSSSLTKIA